MHRQARDWVRRNAPDEPVVVVECGSRDVNGTVRDCFTATRYTGVDLQPGPAVDVVGDWLDYRPDALADVVVMCEVSEHTPDWPDHVAHAARLLKPGGRFIFTAAGPGRPPHSAIDGRRLQPQEHYENIDPDRLADVLARHFADHVVDVALCDVRAVAIR